MNPIGTGPLSRRRASMPISTCRAGSSSASSSSAWRLSRSRGQGRGLGSAPAGRERWQSVGDVPYLDLKDTPSSVSGQTKETLAMMKTAIDRNASVVSISSGGRIQQVLRRGRSPPHEGAEGPRTEVWLPFMLFSSFAVTNRALGARTGSRGCKCGERDEKVVEGH